MGRDAGEGTDGGVAEELESKPKLK